MSQAGQAGSGGGGGGGVTSITATAPLTANGVSGSAQTGDVTIATGALDYFNAVNSSNQTNYFGNTSEVGITAIFDNAESNLNGNYDTSTGIYTCPADGFYQFVVNMGFRSITAANVESNIGLNNVGQMIVFNPATFVAAGTGFSGVVRISSSWSGFLSANTQVSVNVVMYSTSQNVTFANNSTFSGIQLA